MAMVESGRLGANLQGTVVHTGSNPEDPRNSTSKKGQGEAGTMSGEQAARRPEGG